MASCFVGYVLRLWLSVATLNAEPNDSMHVYRCNAMQAMNGTRSAELSASDLMLDSAGSDTAQQQHQLPAAEDATLHASQHATAPDTVPRQPAVQQADKQAADAQQGGVGSQEVVHHESGPSWQQSEGSMQEVASTSASSDSGTTSSHSCQPGTRPQLSKLSCNQVSPGWLVVLIRPVSWPVPVLLP